MAFQSQFHQPYGQEQQYGHYAQNSTQTHQHQYMYSQQQAQPQPPPYTTNSTIDPQKTANVRYNPVEQAHIQEKDKGRFSGFRVSLTIFSFAALLVLAANIGISIYCVRQYGNKPTTSFKPVYTGDCKKTKQLNTVVHLIINILSSVLLTGSNFSMQVLTAPTRPQIDQAHSKRTWLDIGVPSLRNLKSMGRKRLVLWSLILISSAPLHLV